MLFALDICVNKAPPTHSVHWGLANPPPFKNITPSFLPSPLLNLQTIQATLFRRLTSKNCFFHAPP